MVVPTVLSRDVVKVINSLNNKIGNINEISVFLSKANKEHLALPLSSFSSTNRSKMVNSLQYLNVQLSYLFTKRAIEMK